jgi:hypothetical protein
LPLHPAAGASDQRRPRHDGLRHSGRASGALLAEPEATVITVSGDGSIMMNIQELATLRRYRLPLKIVLLDNSQLGMVRQWQELFFEENFSEIDLSDNPDFAEVARAFGIEAFTIDHRSEVSPGDRAAAAHLWPILMPCPHRPARECVAARPAEQFQRADDGEGLVIERLTIDFTPAEGAVLRMIGLVERRGYVVNGAVIGFRP